MTSFSCETELLDTVECSVHTSRKDIHPKYWLNLWHTSCNKGTSGFTTNTLLIRIQQILLV